MNLIFVIFICILISTNNSYAAYCDNIIQTGKNELLTVTTCESFLDSIDTSEYFYKKSANIENCLSLKNKDDWGGKTEVQCYCPAGFTDEIFGNPSYGISHNITRQNIQQITCAKACSVTYQNIFNTDIMGICSCINTMGCLFQDRTMGKNIIKYIPTVIYVPDNIKEDSSMFFCKQFDCDKHVDPVIINICSMSNIEFEFCDQCPVYCSNENMQCEIDIQSRQCIHKCKSGYFLHNTGHDSDFQSECKKCSKCNVNSQVKVACSVYQDTICEYCERGKHMPVLQSLQRQNIKYMCTECDLRSTNTYAGGDCVFCHDDSVVINLTCVKCNLGPLLRLKSSAITCSDTIQNEFTEYQCNNGTEWDFVLDLCIPCKLNMYSNEETKHMCVPCMAHTTSGIGSSYCTKCANTHVRPYYENSCRECTPGTYVDHLFENGCVACEPGKINVGGISSCVECDDMHFSDQTNTMCLACPLGTIRNGNNSCQKCAMGYHLSEKKCISCNISPNLQCESDMDFIDRCDTNTTEVCHCGYIYCKCIFKKSST